MKTAMQELIEYLTEQLDKVVKEHPIEVSKDTYWRGVKIGLETAIELVQIFNTNEKPEETTTIPSTEWFKVNGTVTVIKDNLVPFHTVCVCEVCR